MRFFCWIYQRGRDLGKVRSEEIRQVNAAYGKADVQAPRTISHVILTREADTVERVAMHVEAGSADTSVNRDIDQQLAAAQRASDDDNLLDGKPSSGNP